jgi:hypothetical protein
MHTYARTRAPALVRARVRVCTCAHVRLRVCPRVRVRVNLRARVFACTRVLVHVRVLATSAARAEAAAFEHNFGPNVLGAGALGYVTRSLPF